MGNSVLLLCYEATGKCRVGTTLSSKYRTGIDGARSVFPLATADIISEIKIPIKVSYAAVTSMNFWFYFVFYFSNSIEIQ